MMKLDYAGGQVVVSDALSHALATFSANIARTGGSEALEIPVLTPDGQVGLAEIVVGPASQLLATSTGGAEVDLEDAGVVEEILARSLALQPSKALPMTAEDKIDDLDFPS